MESRKKEAIRTRQNEEVEIGLKGAISFSLAFLLIGCASTQVAIEDAAKRTAIIAARPILEKTFYAEAPIAPSNRALYLTVQDLPGKAFDPKKYLGNRLRFLAGTVVVPSGDYVIPVMSYCMKSGASSPEAHRYTLGKLTGRVAFAIRVLNAKALTRGFDRRDVQVAIWNIQNGVPYDEMPQESRKIIDTVIPEHRRDLEKPFFQNFVEKWNTLSEKTGIPRFGDATDSLLDALSELGEAIRGIRDFRRSLELGNDYETLKALVSLPGVSQTPGTETTTPWSKLSETVYGRFITSGHYLDVGKLEFRVVSAVRLPQAEKTGLTTIDIASLVADPGAGDIQPLSFSLLQASVAIPLLAVSNPEVVAAFLAALIAAEYTDWQAIEKALKQWGGSTQREIQRLIEKLRQIYTKEFGRKPGQVKVPPAVPPAFPDLAPAKQKTPRPGGGLRARWKDADGNIYEWDYQHGRLEKYDRRGNHRGEYDPDTGQQTKPRNPVRRVEP